MFCFDEFLLGFQHEVPDFQSVVTPIGPVFNLIEEIFNFLVLDIVKVVLVLFDSLALDDEEGVVLSRGRGEGNFVGKGDFDLIVLVQSLEGDHLVVDEGIFLVV
jgi:hypothetical protein